jgi:hypothetical protein
VSVYDDFVLPLVSRPQISKLFDSDFLWVDKINQINLDFISDQIALRNTGCVFKVDGSKDDACLRRYQLQTSLYGG